MMELHPTFIDRAAAVYGQDSDVVARLRAGDEFAGRILDDSSQGGISAAQIVRMIDRGEIHELRTKAVTLMAAKALYSEWNYCRRRATFPSEPDQWGTKPEAWA